MTDALPRHPVTLEEWEALPEDSDLRFELAEGVLMMSPRPVGWHQNAVTELTYRTKHQLPDELTALAEVEVVVSEDPLTIRVPDVTIVPAVVYAENPPRYRAADARLVVEVLSPGTRRVDRVLKSSEYADAGIVQYWIVDLDEPTTLTAYILVDGDYELVAESTSPVELMVAGHPVRLDPSSLTR